uniref:R-spondin Fu-CRD domain-containing protein n=1 Tax=Periophthalmus magnuspinnatus TaxID=409849 RepID=A0A3B4A877_9GOBI
KNTILYSWLTSKQKTHYKSSCRFPLWSWARYKVFSSTAGRLCPTGCVTCSALNGCLSCKSRLFFHLEVDGMRQRGVCLSSCPRGHYGTRSPESFCTRCHSDRFLFRGKCERSYLYTLQGQCYLTCPKGFEPDEQLMQCLPQVHCEVGEWSDWSPCVHKRSMKMYRRGEKTRTRQMLSPPSRFRKPCPKLFQFRKCIFKKRQRLCVVLRGNQQRQHRDADCRFLVCGRSGEHGAVPPQ